MIHELKAALEAAKPNLAAVENKTGISVRTMQNIIAKPDGNYARATVLALCNHFKIKVKK